jgi:hypothetical protein
MKRILSLVAALAVLAFAPAAFAAPTQCMTDQAKKDFTVGGFQVMASACTGSGAPSPCCTGAGAGATCPTYKIAMITSTSSAGTSTTTWSGISANEVSGTGYTAGGNTLAGYTVTVSSNHSCVTFTTPVTWSTATITARAAVIYCSANCPTLDVVGIYCLDGGSCAADTSSTGGTFTINLNGSGSFCVN